MVKLPSGNGVANYFELNSENAVPLNPISENQSVAVILLMNKGSVDCWIENEAEDALTEVMTFDQDGSFMFRVPSKGSYVMMLHGDHASFNISMLAYDK